MTEKIKTLQAGPATERASSGEQFVARPSRPRPLLVEPAIDEAADQFIDRHDLDEALQKTIKLVREHYGNVLIRVNIADLGRDWTNLGIRAVVGSPPWPRERYRAFQSAWGQVVDSDLLLFSEVTK